MTDPRPLLAVCTEPLDLGPNGFVLRVTHLLQELGRRWERVVLLNPYTSSASAHDLHGAHERHSWPTANTWFLDEEDRRAIREAIERGLQTYQPEAMIWWGPPDITSVRGVNRRVPVVLDAIDSDTAHRVRDLLRLPGRNFPRAILDLAAAVRQEWRINRSAAATVVVSESDARMFRRLGGRRIHVVPNGVTVAREVPAPDSRPTVAFTGVMDYEPNVRAAAYLVRRIWPRVVDQVPEARLILAGRSPAEAVVQLARPGAIDVLADVPSMSAVIGAARVCVAPMRSGTGIKNKVLEAWALARPVVMTRLASEGLRLPSGAPAFVHDQPVAFARAVIELLRDKAMGQRVGMACLEHVRAEYAWGSAGESFATIVRRVAHR